MPERAAVGEYIRLLRASRAPTENTTQVTTS
eukprot:COSAG03_NODE_28189_length_218_cov_13.697479_1_plen_30_part_01